MEVLGFILFAVGTMMDIQMTKPSDLLRIIWALGVIFALIKTIYLVRVFQQLNFLVTMITTVINEIMFFILMFAMYLVTFGACFHLVDVDITAYGRMNELLAHILGVLRCAMGDFAMIDMYHGFDLRNAKEEAHVHGVYRQSKSIVLFTWFLWVISIFILFMIFMNFIIAVISDAFATVLEFKIAHDYLQRVIMIYELETHFSMASLENDKYFPNILIIRRKKQNTAMKNNWQNWVQTIKAFIK